MTDERPYIWTCGGAKLYLEPRTVDELPSIKTIAESLGNQVRWTGHAGNRYTLADHSLAVCDAAMQIMHRDPTLGNEVKRELAASALLHDAHECFTGDVNSPLKTLLRRSGCYVLDNLASNFDRLFAYHLGMAPLNSPVIKQADHAVLQAEAELLPIAVGHDVAQEELNVPEDLLIIAKGAVNRALAKIGDGNARDRFWAKFEELRGGL